MDPLSSDQSLPPKPTSSVGNVIPAVVSQNSASGKEPVTPPPPSKPVNSGKKDMPSNNSEQFYPKGARVNRKVVLGLFIVLMLVTIPATVFVARQPQTTQSGAAAQLTPETVIAVINGADVLEKDLEKVAAEQYEQDAIDREALRDALDILIERKILDIEKNASSLGVSDSEITEKTQEGFGEKAAYYEVLKDKVIMTQTKNWEVYTLGFWLPMTDERENLTQEEKKEVQKQHDDGLKAINEAKDQMQTDKSALDIAKDLVDKYPSLKEILGVNGYLLKDLGEGANLSDVENPRNYTFESSNNGQAFFDTLYSLTVEEQVEKYVAEKNSGGGVIKLVSAKTTAPFDNYESWLKAKNTSSFATVVYSL